MAREHELPNLSQFENPDFPTAYSMALLEASGELSVLRKLKDFTNKYVYPKFKAVTSYEEFDRIRRPIYNDMIKISPIPLYKLDPQYQIEHGIAAEMILRINEDNILDNMLYPKIFPDKSDIPAVVTTVDLSKIPIITNKVDIVERSKEINLQQAHAKSLYDLAGQVVKSFDRIQTAKDYRENISRLRNQANKVSESLTTNENGDEIINMQLIVGRVNSTFMNFVMDQYMQRAFNRAFPPMSKN